MAKAFLSGGEDQLAVVEPQAPLPTRVVAEQLLDRDVGRRRARPLGDEVRRGLGDVDVALVLGDAHERGRDRLRDRERLGGDVGRAAAEVALVDDRPVAGHDQARRSAGLGRRRQAVERRGVEAGLGRVDVVPLVAGEAHALVAGRPGRVAVGRRPAACGLARLAVAARRAGRRDDRQCHRHRRPAAVVRHLVPRSTHAAGLLHATDRGGPAERRPNAGDGVRPARRRPTVLPAGNAGGPDRYMVASWSQKNGKTKQASPAPMNDTFPRE